MSSEVLQVEGIDVYYGSSQVLFNMSLAVRQGETLALLGRNGAGKSTTMKAIAAIANKMTPSQIKVVRKSVPYSLRIPRHVETNRIHTMEIGISTFQPKRMNWS